MNINTCNEDLLRGYDETLNLILDGVAPMQTTEMIDISDSMGRVQAEDVLSKMDLPSFDNSAMDGWAINLPNKLFGKPGVKEFKIVGRIAAGEVSDIEVGIGEAVRIFTGAEVPAGANCIVKQENCEEVVKGMVPTLEVYSPINENSNIRPRGKDISLGEIIIKRGELLTPGKIAGLASIGIKKVQVIREISVGVFFTGSELVALGNELGRGEIYNSNESAIISELKALGCRVISLGIVEDSFKKTVEAINELSGDCDVIITTGGVSVGEEDYIKKAIESMGEVTTWKSKIKPGKPVAIGRIDSGSMIMGLPGNVVSSFVTFHLYAKPFIRKFQGLNIHKNCSTQKKITYDWPRPKDRREFSRVIEDDHGNINLCQNQQSNAVSSIIEATGLAEMEEMKTYKKGDFVNYIKLV